MSYGIDLFHFHGALDRERTERLILHGADENDENHELDRLSSVSPEEWREALAALAPGVDPAETEVPLDEQTGMSLNFYGSSVSISFPYWDATSATLRRDLERCLAWFHAHGYTIHDSQHGKVVWSLEGYVDSILAIVAEMVPPMRALAETAPAARRPMPRYSARRRPVAWKPLLLGIAITLLIFIVIPAVRILF